MSTTGSFFVTKYNSLGNAIWAIGNFFEARKIVNYLKGTNFIFFWAQYHSILSLLE